MGGVWSERDHRQKHFILVFDFRILSSDLQNQASCAMISAIKAVMRNSKLNIRQREPVVVGTGTR